MIFIAIFDVLIFAKAAMKPLKPSIITIILCVIISILFEACKTAPGPYINQDIPSGKAGDFHELNNTLLKALKENNVKLLETIMSNELMQMPGTNRQVELCSIRLKEDKYTMLDEVYVVHDKRDNFTVKMPGKGVNAYSLSYTPLTRERYMAMYTVNYRAEKWLLTAIYNKYNYGWKLTEFELSPYTISGRTAPELYHEAKTGYAKGYLVGAINLMDRSRRCAIPSSIWQYNEMTAMDNFYSKILDEGNKRFDFPVVVNQMPSQPRIIAMSNTDAGDGISPMVSYISKFDIKNETAVKAEHEQLKKIIGDVLPGIDKQNKHVYYTVFNKSPYGAKEKVPFMVIEDKY